MSNHQREIESYEKIFTYLDGSGRETRRKSEFQDKLDQVDDIDKYKVNVRLLQRDGEFELNNRHGYTPLFFALWLISEDSDAGIGFYPEIDDWVKLLVLKGSDVEYTHDGVSVLDYFQRIKDFYMNEDEEEFEFFIGDLTPAQVRTKINKIEDYLTGKSVKKIQSRFRGNQSRLESKAEGRITKKQLEADWIHLKRQMQASGFKPDQIERFHRDHYRAGLKKKKRRKSKKKKKFEKYSSKVKKLSKKLYGHNWKVPEFLEGAKNISKGAPIPTDFKTHKDFMKAHKLWEKKSKRRKRK